MHYTSLCLCVYTFMTVTLQVLISIFASVFAYIFKGVDFGISSDLLSDKLCCKQIEIQGHKDARPVLVFFSNLLFAYSE